ncbi:uncharacterized protein [Misgurnus anguillicaudatus]|uniref:uncharacterized protein n=1 Tax=Misgurnus anguillicaudatus TaxID=75329 RepID=UPI0024348E20|nr:uncharacterized protein LOC129435092 [Misgurnus anguillicaudatus]XP_055065449.1 uncharacterized protein LOC129447724 [Misgurnus anguillicaudatus]
MYEYYFNMCLFFFSVDLCKAKWRSLRDTFVKTRKKVPASGSAGGCSKEWKYADIMSFIVPYVQQRSSKSNLAGVLAEEERSSTPVSMCGSDGQGSSISTVPPDSQRPHTVSPSPSGLTTSGVTDRPHRSRSPRERVPVAVAESRRSHRPQTSDVEERLLSMLQDPLPKPDSELAESYHFAMSLVPLLHRLDRNKRRQAKIGILNLLHNVEDSTERQEPAGPSSVFHPPPTFHHPSTFHTPTATLAGPGIFRPSAQPPPTHPIGPYTGMLSEDTQWG